MKELSSTFTIIKEMNSLKTDSDFFKSESGEEHDIFHAINDI